MVFRMDAMPAALLPDVFTQELVCFRIENPNVQMIPLYLDESADPPWWYAIESGVYFDATIKVDHPFAVLVITKRFNRQWKKRGLLFCKHRCDLPFRCAMNASVGPPRFPV